MMIRDELNEDRLLSADPVRLIAVDLDGTLLRSDGSICAPSAEAIADAIEAGIKVVIATGRAPRNTMPIYNALGLDTLIIAHNGALIYDPATRTEVAHETMDAQLAREVVRIARSVESSVAVGVEARGKCYTDTNRSRQRRAQRAAALVGNGAAALDGAVAEQDRRRAAERRTGDPDATADLPANPRLVSAAGMDDPDGPLAEALVHPATKVMLLGAPHALGAIQMALHAKLNSSISFAFSDFRLLQIVRGGVDKAGALGKVAAHYGVPRQSVMTIGDAPNDVGMLQWAGYGVSTMNAWQDVRDAAHFTCPSNDNNGVAEAIRKYAMV